MKVVRGGTFLYKEGHSLNLELMAKSRWLKFASLYVTLKFVPTVVHVSNCDSKKNWIQL